MRRALIAATLSFGPAAYAQSIVQQCQQSNQICYSLNIPEATASSGNGDIFFQIQAPTSYSWVALGQGSSMSGANIFVMYTSSDGNNVTISPRLGRGHVEPNFNGDAQVSLLEGSGVSNGVMTANVRCSNCQSWSGGSMDFTGDSATWIWAARTGSSLNSDSTSEDISQHGSEGSFRLRLAQAKGGNTVNPFVSSGTSSPSETAASPSARGTDATATGTATKSCIKRPRTSATGAGTTGASVTSAATQTDAGSYPTNWAEWSSYRATATGPPSNWPSNWAGPTGSPSGFPGWQYGPPSSSEAGQKRDDSDDDEYCEDDDPASPPGRGGIVSNSDSGLSGISRENQILMAHGILASLAMVIFFPAGAISIRLFSFPGLVWVHAGIQLFSYLVYIAAFGLGVHIASNLRMMNEYHPIIGIVVFVLLCFQPVLGILHHAMFKKYNMRTFWSYGHIWLGRIAITLGIINGGLGLKLANNTTSGKIAYAVVAAVVWLVYMAAAVYGELKKKRTSTTEPPPYKRSNSNEGSPSPLRREYYAKREGGYTES